MTLTAPLTFLLLVGRGLRTAINELRTPASAGAVGSAPPKPDPAEPRASANFAASLILKVLLNYRGAITRRQLLSSNPWATQFLYYFQWLEACFWRRVKNMSNFPAP
jgi:hypothetical protein